MASYKPRAKKDLTGQRFGALTVLHEGEPHIFPRGTTERTWVCKCDCGNEITATMSRLTGGLATSCGCKSKLGRAMLRSSRQNMPYDLTGKTYGNFFVIGFAGERLAPNGAKSYLWRVRCGLCGREKVMDGVYVRTATLDDGCGCRQATLSHVCKRCGKTFLGARHAEYCPSCLAAEVDPKVAYRPEAPIESKTIGARQRIYTCKLCGGNFVGATNSRYCPACKALAHARNEKTRRTQKSLGKARTIGSTDYCVECGKPYVVTSSSQKYCPDCQKGKRRKDGRNQQHTKPPKQSSYDQAPADHKGKSLKKICAICGKPFYASPSEVNQQCCSKKCGAALRLKNGNINNAAWSDEAKARRSADPEIQAHMQTLQSVGVSAALKLPGGQKGPQNREALVWRLIDPDGNTHKAVNLLDWARQNHLLFFDDDIPEDVAAKRIAAGFRAIATSIRGTRLKSRPASSYKGWQLAGLPTPKTADDDNFDNTEDTPCAK